MLGAIIGDTVGSVYEFDNIKTTTFEPFFHPESEFTDDSILSIAIADWLLNSDRSQKELEDCFLKWGERFPNPMGGYGSGFERWLFHPEILHAYRDREHADDPDYGTRHPYYSWSNGSAMRASACGWVAASLEEALDLAKRSAQITHNHPEGIKGAQATAAVIFMARKGYTKAQIHSFIEREFNYNLNQSCDDIRPYYAWEASCKGTVPPAIIAFLESTSFENAIRLAISLGGDSDTLACITGGMAEAYASAHRNTSAPDYYEGVTQSMAEHMRQILPQDMWNIIIRVLKSGMNM